MENPALSPQPPIATMIFVVLGKRALKVSMGSNGVNVLPLLKFSDGANAMIACVTDDTRSLDGRLEWCHLDNECLSEITSTQV